MFRKIFLNFLAKVDVEKCFDLFETIKINFLEVRLVIREVRAMVMCYHNIKAI